MCTVSRSIVRENLSLRDKSDTGPEAQGKGVGGRGAEDRGAENKGAEVKGGEGVRRVQYG